MVVFVAWLWRPRGEAGYLSGSRSYTSRLPKLALIPLGGFCAYVFLQTVPLPADMIAALSPATVAQHRMAPGLGERLTLSLSPERTTNDLLLLYACVAVFLVAAFPTKGQINRRRLSVILVGTGVAVSLLAILQKATQHGNAKIYWAISCRQDPCGPFVNPSDFAGYVILLIPIALAVGFGRSPGAGPRGSGKWTVFGVVSAVIMTIALVLSASRSGIAGVLVAVALLSVTLAIGARSRRKRVAVITAAVLICVLGAWAATSRLMEKMERAGVAWGERALLWRESSVLARDFRICGTGLGTFGVVFPQHRKGLTQQVSFTNAENDFLELLIETGLIGGVLFGTFLGLWAASGVRAASAMFGGFRAALICGAGAGCAAMLVHDFFHFSLRIPANAVLFAVCLALLHPASRGSGKGSSDD
ncbi:MAG: O-antigen ligase family protein [Planctomycetes bacterium]|nr:O-antigen ligase family protein [Planctomycetota bacterium]